MDGYRRCLWLLVAVGVAGLSGASCRNLVPQFAAPLPRVLPPSPTLEQVIEVVNRNSLQIHSFSTMHATLGGPGLPTLRASVAFQRPRRFRLRADTAVTGPELDLGSNDQLFWFWCRRNQPPAVYYCRHEHLATSRARQMLLLDPNWLLEAVGIAGFDPGLPHQGPFFLPGDRLEVRTIRDTPEGLTRTSTVVDAARGWVLEEHVYDAQGRLVASSILSHHRRDPLLGLVMPTVVKINYPAAELSLQLDLGNVQVNRLPGNQAELWTMPRYQGSPPVDLCGPGFQSPPMAAPPATSFSPSGAPSPLPTAATAGSARGHSKRFPGVVAHDVVWRDRRARLHEAVRRRRDGSGLSAIARHGRPREALTPCACPVYWATRNELMNLSVSSEYLMVPGL
jgi:hypothetical protein